MSQRGSFVTEHIYCEKCLAAVVAVLATDPHKYLWGTLLPFSADGPDPNFPIVAGKIGGLYAGEEIHEMERYIEELEPHLCHDIKIAVLAESGEAILTAKAKMMKAGPEEPSFQDLVMEVARLQALYRDQDEARANIEDRLAFTKCQMQAARQNLDAHVSRLIDAESVPRPDLEARQTRRSRQQEAQPHDGPSPGTG